MPVDFPSAYWVEREPEGTLAILRSYHEALTGLGYGVRSDGERVPSDLQGRGNLEEFHLPGQVLIIRRFRRGGWVRFASKDRFLDPERPFREILLSQFLRQRGFHTPLVVAARARRIGILGYRLEIVTEKVEGAESMGQRLRAASAEGGSALRRLPWRRTGELVRALHDQGFLHSDLQPENLLWRARDQTLWVLDLDRSKAESAGELTRAAKASNLWRLWRYVLRRDGQGARVLGAVHYLRFLRGYEPDRGLRRQWVAALQTIRAERSRWHRGHSQPTPSSAPK